MRIVFFDTDFISNWHKDEEKFRVPIAATLHDLERLGDVARMYTAINHHELVVWGLRKQRRAALERFLREQFSRPVAFDEIAARHAADLQEQSGTFPVRKKETTKAAYVEEKDIWFRDVAMLGIARAHSAHAVVTCSRDLARLFGAAVHPTRIILVEELSAASVLGDAE